MLIRRSAPHPRSRNTPSGGRIIAKMILQMSEAVNAIDGSWTDICLVTNTIYEGDLRRVCFGIFTAINACSRPPFYIGLKKPIQPAQPGDVTACVLR